MLQLGHDGQHYVIAEVTQGTTPALAASNACRHMRLILGGDNKNRRTIVEKKVTPWVTVALRTDGRQSANFEYEGVIRPSGTINTLPEIAPYLLAGFGEVTNTALSTTVSVGTGAVGGATLASTTGLVAKKSFVSIVCPDGKKRLRRILTLPGSNVVTWAPNLPAAPADGAAVKAAASWSLTSANAKTLSILHYLKKTDKSTTGLLRGVTMAGVDKMLLSFDGNDDPTIVCSGLAKALGDPPSQPGGFTQVGGTPPSGIVGDMLIGNTAMPFLKASFELTNGLRWRSNEYGVSAASEVYRSGSGLMAAIGINCYAETESILYDLSEAGTVAGVFKQTGYSEGNDMAVYAPNVEFQIPGTDDPEDEVKWDFKGLSLESADGENDVLYFAIG